MKIVSCLVLFTLYLNAQQGGRRNEKSITEGRHDSYKTTSTWMYRKTQVGEIQESELPKLFKWTITPNRKKYREIQEEQRQQRAKYRIRGNEVFHRKKYNF